VGIKEVEESRLVEAAFASAVRAAGISEIVESVAEVRAVRSVYVRRRRRLTLESPLIAQTDGILEALDKLQSGSFLMIRFGTRTGLKGIVMATMSGTPIYAFPLTSETGSGA
jgi:hypothetical protein